MQIAEEVHRREFLKRQAKGDDLLKSRIKYAKETRLQMINAYPEGSAERSHLEKLLPDDQAVLNKFVRMKPPVGASGGWCSVLFFGFDCEQA